jgi:hypothetical protein
MNRVPKIQPRTMTLLILRGFAPGPLNIPGLGRLLFDREQQDRAMDVLRQPPAEFFY